MTLQGGKRKVVAVGNYRFTGKLLGKGNFARVEEAVHVILNVKVAVKIMDINQIKEEYVIKNLCREAKILSKLNHPCIAALYQTMQRSDNTYYLVTELVSGGDLCSFVKGQRNGKLEERPTRIYGRQFASALSHMHSLGVVHRDLKMENVMLNSIQTQIKIVDFGLSNVWTADNPLRTHCGSPEYAAPELFVTGKQYGAEVDLWSLGIILYGMVLGQLPFVSNRSDHVSSQERRKKLVALINKGLATPHRRAIASFSPEFRHLMNRLLVADSSKRITAKDLIVHPWITEKGRKLVRTNPIKNLDSHSQAKIITDIACLMQGNPKIIMTAIVEDPFGKIGGMFNMLVHKQQMNQLNGDGITRTLPSLTLLELTDSQNGTGKDSTLLRISTARNFESRNPYTAASTRRTQFYTPRANLHEKITGREGKEKMIVNKITEKSTKKDHNVLNKKEQNIPKNRPNTVHVEKNYETVDYRLIKSPSLRRKAYSATITPKTNRTQSPSIEKNNKQINVLREHSAKDDKRKGFTNECRPIGKKGISDALNTTSKTQGSPRQGHLQQRVVQPRVRTANPEKTRIKSDHIAGMKRPTTGPLNRNADRSIKYGSPPSVTVSQSASRTIENKAGVYTRASTRQNREIDSKEQWERSPLAFGDIITRSPRGPQKQEKTPLIYDPIARSIAEYVVNNVPNKLHNFTWFRK